MIKKPSYLEHTSLWDPIASSCVCRLRKDRLVTAAPHPPSPKPVWLSVLFYDAGADRHRQVSGSVHVSWWWSLLRMERWMNGGWAVKEGEATFSTNIDLKQTVGPFWLLFAGWGLAPATAFTPPCHELRWVCLCVWGTEVRLWGSPATVRKHGLREKEGRSDRADKGMLWVECKNQLDCLVTQNWVWKDKDWSHLISLVGDCGNIQGGLAKNDCFSLKEENWPSKTKKSAGNATLMAPGHQQAALQVAVLNLFSSENHTHSTSPLHVISMRVLLLWNLC